MNEPGLTKEEIREIAQTEAQKTAEDVLEEEIETDDGETWSIRRFMTDFNIGRRAAMGAFALMMIGAVGNPAEAALKAVAGTAEGATGGMTIPGDLTVNGTNSTDSAIIGGHDTIKGIEAGTVSHGDPGSASDGTWDTSNQNTQSVSFAQSFSTTPKVAISANTGTYGVVYRYNVSTTGFSSSWRIFRSDASASTDADWVAVEV